MTAAPPSPALREKAVDATRPSPETPAVGRRTWGMKTTPPRPEPERPVRTLRPFYADTSTFRGWGPRVPGI